MRKNTLAAKRAIVATLAKRKAENVDQSDSSIPFAAAPEDTPALVKDDPHLTPYSPASGSNLLQPILVMKTTQNRLGPHSISRRESDVVVFAVAPEGRLPALGALVPGSNVGRAWL